MKRVALFLLAGLLIPGYAIEPKKLIKGFLESWKTSEVIDLPGLGIPDPYTDIADFDASGIQFTSNRMSGLSKLQILSLRIEQDKNDTFQVSAELLLPEFLLQGYFYRETFLGTYSGNYTATVSGIRASGMAVPIVDESGMLQLEKIQPDLVYDDMNIEFEGETGLFGAVIAGLANSLNTLVFNFVKPTLVGSVNEKLIPEINEYLSTKVTIRFPNSVTLLDSFLANERTKSLASKIEMKNETIGGAVKIYLTNGYLEGLRTLHRAGPMKIMLINHTFHALFEFEAGYLRGGFDWRVPFWVTDYSGQMSFIVKGFRVLIDLSQSANIQEPAQLDHLKLHIDEIQVMTDGLGYADYLLELAANVLPNLLKDSLYSRISGHIRAMINLFLEQNPVEGFINLHLE